MNRWRVGERRGEVRKWTDVPLQSDSDYPKPRLDPRPEPMSQHNSEHIWGILCLSARFYKGNYCKE
jgi:hypothetical protein